MKLAGLSIDVDSVTSHLEGYGFERPPDDGTAYRLAIPRALDALSRGNARATFFLIAEEAKRHPDSVAEIVRRGHEVASHSMTHRLPFSHMSEERLASEIGESKALLEVLSGERVQGFRAPSWDLSADIFGALVESGYRYDASTYPSLLLPLLRLSIAKRSVGGRTRTESSIWEGVFGPTRPHLRRHNGGALAEIPICTAPYTRFPYYHTLRFLLPAPAFAALGALARTRRGPITYQFHAVDFLAVDPDGLDPRIGRHPGMRLPLERKLDLAARAIAELGSRRQVVPLVEIVDQQFGQAREPAQLVGGGNTL
jgi:hypothetical protein